MSWLARVVRSSIDSRCSVHHPQWGKMQSSGSVVALLLLLLYYYYCHPTTTTATLLAPPDWTDTRSRNRTRDSVKRLAFQSVVQVSLLRVWCIIYLCQAIWTPRLAFRQLSDVGKRCQNSDLQVGPQTKISIMCQTLSKAMLKQPGWSRFWKTIAMPAGSS